MDAAGNKITVLCAVPGRVTVLTSTWMSSLVAMLTGVLRRTATNTPQDDTDAPPL